MTLRVAKRGRQKSVKTESDSLGLILRFLAFV